MSFGKGQRQKGRFYLDRGRDHDSGKLRNHGGVGADVVPEFLLVPHDISVTDSGVEIALVALGQVLTEIALNPRESGTRYGSENTEE